MSQPANDEFSQHLSGEESNHEDASDTGAAPKQQQQMIPQTTAISNIKLPILKKEEYDIWAMEMEHYQGISTGKDGIVRVLSPVTAAEIQAVEKERKAKNILLMAIPKEHMRRFHGMDDVKEIWEAIRTKFGEGLEKGYDRFQQLLSQLEARGAAISIENANHKKSEGEFAWMEKQPVGFDKKKLECFNCHNTEAGKQEKNQMGLLTMDDGIVNWGEHTEVEEKFNALRLSVHAIELGDQEAQILAYSQAVKKLEAQLVTFQKQQLSLNEKLTFQANEIYEKDEKLKRYRRIGMKAVKEKEQLQKTLDSWKDSSKNL
ncbi:hypothetical protein Tco_0696998 [Tanacetum coccineum]